MDCPFILSPSTIFNSPHFSILFAVEMLRTVGPLAGAIGCAGAIFLHQAHKLSLQSPVDDIELLDHAHCDVAVTGETLTAVLRGALDASLWRCSPCAKHPNDQLPGAGRNSWRYARAHGDADVVLLDSNSKKTRFLSEVKRLLGLSNIKVETTRVETWHPEPPVDAVITRAFADLPTTLKRIDHVLGDHGVLFAMKTESASEELTALPEGIQHTATQQIVVPGRQWGFQLLTFNRLGGALP